MTKTLMTTAIVLMMTSFGASANFQPWESACDKYRQAEIHGQPADIEIGPYYRDESQVTDEVPDTVQQAAKDLGPFYLKD